MTRAVPKTVHTLKVTLRGVRPPVWRRIVVRSETKLSVLADQLMGAMGWYGGHLHQFETSDRRIYSLPDELDIGIRFGPAPMDERKHRLGDVLPKVGAKLRFDYDFGDGWEHDVVVEAIEPAARGVDYLRCIAGRRACPPEDCGGPWGYADLLEAIADPKHERHDDLMEWLGGEFDPDDFDVEGATDDMQSPPALTGW